jgi:pimeloyl-ACP methyl ester carboxylesterase
MSTPPFIAMPDGVALFAPPSAPAPILLAEAAPSVTDGAGVADDRFGDVAGGERAPVAAPESGARARGGTSESGARARGDVLLVPGFTGSKEDYIAVLAPLAARGWRVAAMDLPGQGGFAGLGPVGSHTPESLATSVLAVAEWFAPGRPVHLVGHSMGGLVSRAALLADPGRVASWTAMCSGPGPVPEETHAPLLQLQASLKAAPMELIWAQKEAMDRKAGWVPPSEEVAQFCARRFIANDPAALADFAGILMHASDRTDEAAAVLAASSTTGAVVTGALDDAWPVDQQGRMAERLGVAWHVIPDVGHNPSTEDPDATVGVLDGIFAGADAGSQAGRSGPGRPKSDR